MKLIDVLDIRFPIIQAPMAGVQGGRLAAAVSKAGGLGSIPCAMLSADQIRAEVEFVRQHTNTFNLNFFCHEAPEADAAVDRRWGELLRPYYEEAGIELPRPSSDGRMPFSEEALELIEELKPPVTSFHFGLPEASMVARIKALGTIVLSSATTVEEAVYLEANGADVIIAQGAEAGGHRAMFLVRDPATQVGTFALVPQVVAAVSVPVVAAGGIASRAGVESAMALGAAGVQVGTAFLLCPEADTSPLHRCALTSEAAKITAITNVFTGRPARAIVNRMVRELGPMNVEAPMFPLAANALGALRAEAEARGSSDFSSHWSGQNTGGCAEIPAADLMRGLLAHEGDPL